LAQAVYENQASQHELLVTSLIVGHFAEMPVMRSVQEQTIAASKSSAVLAPTPTAAEDSCRQNRDEVDETASTIVPDQLEAERNTDFEDSEDEQEPAVDAKLGQATKLRWADLTSDSEAEEPSSVEALAPAARPRWADLEDSDKETSPPQASSSSAVAVVSSSAAAPTSFAAAVSGRDSTGKEDSRESQGLSGKWARAQQGSKAATWRDLRSNNKQLRGYKGGDSRSYNKQWWGSQGGRGNWQQGWTSSQQSWNHSHAASSGVESRSAKPQCQFFIGIAEEPAFKVTSRVLGPHGQHMKAIAEATGAKMRLRGKGSGFLESEDRRESTDELMLCVSAQDWTSYQETVSLVTELLNGVYDQYKTFCRRSGAQTTSIEIRMHEGARPGSR